MLLLWPILKRLLAWVFPVLLLENCMNRDPYIEIDERFSILAVCGSCPKILINKAPDWRQSIRAVYQLDGKAYEEALHHFEQTQKWELEGVTEYKLSESVITGNSAKGYFIADRRSGTLLIFGSDPAREWTLRHEYNLNPEEDLHPPPLWMHLRSRAFWPWFHLYFLACLLFIPWLTIRADHRSKKQYYDLPS
ncbi:MAG: hypothetical protein V4662_05410 [Verrucomicrobiota bacterium]